MEQHNNTGAVFQDSSTDKERIANRVGINRYQRRQCGEAQNHKRKQHIQLLTGTLPVITKRVEARPDLYAQHTDGTCCTCHSAKEDFDHVFMCLLAQKHFESTVANINEIVKENTTASLWEQIEPTEALPCINPQHLYETDEEPTEYFGETTDARTNTLTFKTAAGYNRKMLFRGAIPKALPHILEVLGCEKKKTKKVCDKILDTILEGLLEVWKERCNITIKWETEHGITARSKKNKRPITGKPEQQATPNTDTITTEAAQVSPPVMENTDVVNTPQETTNEHQYNHESVHKRRKTQWTQEDKQTCEQCGDALWNHVDQWSICRTRGRIFTEAIVLHCAHTQFEINVLS